MALAIRIIDTLPADCQRELGASGWEVESAQVEKAGEGKGEGTSSKDGGGDAHMGENAERSWNLQEKEKLLNCIVRIFTTACPHYIAYKHMVHATLDVSLFSLHSLQTCGSRNA